MAKKLRLLIPILLLVWILCGCSTYHTPTSGMVITEIENGPTYTLDSNNKTILYDGTLYYYSVTRNGDDISYTVTYPNGGVYFYNSVGNVVSAGGNEDYDEVTYLSGEILVELLRHHYYISHSSPNFGHYFILLLCLGLGAFDLFSDKASRVRHLGRIIALIWPLMVMNLGVGIYNTTVGIVWDSPINVICSGIPYLLTVLIGIGCLKLGKKRNRLKREGQIFE